MEFKKSIYKPIIHNRISSVASSQFKKKTNYLKDNRAFVIRKFQKMNDDFPVTPVQMQTGVIQRLNNEELTEARGVARRVDQLSIAEVREWQHKVENWMRELHFSDPRLRILEHLSNVFGRQIATREENRPHLMTRVLSEDQLIRPSIGIKSTRRSQTSLRRNLGNSLVARGSGTTDVKRLYSFMRSFGGAGMQGFHGNPMAQLSVIHSILSRILKHRRAQSQGVSKLAMVAVDRRRLNSKDIFDTRNPSVRKMFLTMYHRFRNMYNDHEKESVVAVKGNVDTSAIKGLRAFKGVPSQAELQQILEMLLDLASAEPEPMYKHLQRRDDDSSDDESGGSSGSGMGGESASMVTA